MNKIAQIEKVVIINNVNDILTVSTTQIAEHFEKQHKDVIKATENLIKETSAQNFANLFIESTYLDKYGRAQKSYECTRDGFTLLAMGFTGKKALEWKLKYIKAFNKMEQTIKTSYKALSERQIKASEDRSQAMLINAKARLMKEQNKRIELMIKNPEYTPADEEPPIVPKTYSAGEVGAMLGVSANKIGRLANANGLKDNAYGEWYKEPLESGKEVEVFRYNQKGIDKLRELLK